MFGPLAFLENEPDGYKSACLLCQDSFNLELCFATFVKHLFEVHHLVIEDVQNIDNFREYLSYWRDKFTKMPIEQILPAISDTSSTKYFLLSTLTQEDKELRHRLKLERMLKVQEFEREDSDFTKLCLFCKLDFMGKRGDYVRHLSEKHNIRLGNPQNLVYIDELIDKMERILNNLQCLYCERTFRDRTIMKEHMRKKQHKTINPSNQTYDKFYAVNYLHVDRKWHGTDEQVELSQDCGDTENSDLDYAGWNEADASIVCLFCKLVETNINKLCLHMNSKHLFNFYTVSRHMDFYQRVKLVNYIRRQIHGLRCIFCNANFQENESLEAHMKDDNHCRLPEDAKAYDHPEFYFSTYENDSFLYFLDEIED